MHILSPVTDNCPSLNQRKEKQKYVARPDIEPWTSDLRVRCPTDCATRPGSVLCKCAGWFEYLQYKHSVRSPYTYKEWCGVFFAENSPDGQDVESCTYTSTGTFTARVMAVSYFETVNATYDVIVQNPVTQEFTVTTNAPMDYPANDC